MIFLKFLSLVISIWFTTVTICRVCHGQAVNRTTFMIMSLALATFIFLQFHLY